MAGGQDSVVLPPRAQIIGDTVCRTSGPWTPAVQALLRHYEAVDCTAAPRALGVDELGREVVSYIDGLVPENDPPPPDDETVFRIGSLLRELHDAQAGFVVPRDAHWQVLPGTVTGGTPEVICHHDALGPNTVFQEGVPAALIDWELASPAARVVDVAAAAAYWVPLRPDRGAEAMGLPVDRRPERLRAITDGYKLDRDSRAVLLSVVGQLLAGWHENFRVLGGIRRLPKWAEHWDSGGASGIPKAIDWLQSVRSDLERALR
jgi:hypothetical protein